MTTASCAFPTNSGRSPTTATWTAWARRSTASTARVQADIIGVAADNAGMSYNEIVDGSDREASRVPAQPAPPGLAALFGADLWADTCPEADAEMLERYRGFGEIDIAATTSFVTEGDTTLVATVEPPQQLRVGRGSRLGLTSTSAPAGPSTKGTPSM